MSNGNSIIKVLWKLFETEGHNICPWLTNSGPKLWQEGSDHDSDKIWCWVMTTISLKLYENLRKTGVQDKNFVYNILLDRIHYLLLPRIQWGEKILEIWMKYKASSDYMYAQWTRTTGLCCYVSFSMAIMSNVKYFHATCYK